VAEAVERVDPTLVKVNIGIAWEDFEKKYHESIRKVGESVRIRGFRKGRAPLAILEKLFGKEVMMEAAVESVSEKGKELLKQESLLLIRDEFDVRENVVIEDRKEVRYTHELEVLPEIKDLSFDGVEIEDEAAVDEGRVEEELRKLAARKAPVAARPGKTKAGEFDVVVVSGTVVLDDPELKPIELKDERVDLSPWSSQPQELTRVFLGRKAGDKVEETVPYPVSLKTGETVPARMSCKVTSVLGREIPEIDDELAKDYDFKSLDDMRNEIRKQLEQDAHQGWVNESAEKVIEALIKKFDVPLPRSYRQMVEERLKAADGGEKEAKGKADMKADYEKEFKKFILTQVIAMKNKLQISAEDLQRNIEAVSSLLQRMNMEEGKRREFMKNWLREYETAQFFKIVNGFLVDKVMETGKKKGSAGRSAAKADGGGPKADAKNESK